MKRDFQSDLLQSRCLIQKELTTSGPQVRKRDLKFWRRYLLSDSIPDDVIRISHWLYPSGRTKAPEWTQALREMRNILGEKGGQCVVLSNLWPSWAGCLEILGASTYWSLKGLSRPVECAFPTVWNATPCSLLQIHERFGKMCSLHFQGYKKLWVPGYSVRSPYFWHTTGCHTSEHCNVHLKC